MNLFTKKQASSKQPPANTSEAGKVKVKFFWKTSLLISIILTVVGTIVLNLLING